MDNIRGPVPKDNKSSKSKKPRRSSKYGAHILKGKGQRYSALDQPVPSTMANNKHCHVQEDLKAVKGLLFGSWISILFLFMPIGIVAHALDWSPTVIFFTNFVAMIPLANLLGDSTESLAEHLGETIGGLLNATFGNAVEIVVMIMALMRAKHADDEERETLMTVVQTSLIGSIFSNSLLVLGCSFIANGVNYHEGVFCEMVAAENVSLLLLAAFVMILPGPYSEHSGSGSSDSLMVSRCAAVVLLLLYCCLMVFVLFTHSEDMTAPSGRPSVSMSRDEVLLQIAERDYKRKSMEKTDAQRQQLLDEDFEDHTDPRSVDVESGSEDGGHQMMSLGCSCIMMGVSTVTVAFLSEYLVSSISGMATKMEMSPAFVGIILLPIIGNAVEHLTAVRMAYNNKMDVAISIAIGSATQVAMLVVGLAVLIAWMMDLPLDLAFNPFEVNIFLFSTIIIFTLVSDGKSNWLEGVMLVGLYVLIAVAVWPQNYSN